MTGGPGPGPRVGDSGMEASVGSWLTMDILILETVLVVLVGRRTGEVSRFDRRLIEKCSDAALQKVKNTFNF